MKREIKDKNILFALSIAAEKKARNKKGSFLEVHPLQLHPFQVHPFFQVQPLSPICTNFWIAVLIFKYFKMRLARRLLERSMLPKHRCLPRTSSRGRCHQNADISDISTHHDCLHSPSESIATQHLLTGKVTSSMCTNFTVFAGTKSTLKNQLQDGIVVYLYLLN